MLHFHSIPPLIINCEPIFVTVRLIVGPIGCVVVCTPTVCVHVCDVGAKGLNG